jgi:catechol 2,3-dioxygenase
VSAIELSTRPIHITPRRICHVNLFVGSTEKSLDFYHRIGGLEIVMRQPDINAGFLSNGSTHHDLGMLQVTAEPLYGEQGHRIIAARQGSEPGLYHVGWEMESELELVKAYERLLASGYKVNRTVRHRASHSVYIFDPDGNIHEFYADVDRDWRNLYANRTSLSGEWRPDASTATWDARYDDNPPIHEVKDAPLHPVRFSHAVLRARNHEAMCDFFRNVAGLRSVFSAADGSMQAFKAAANQHFFSIALVRDDAPAKGRKSLSHFGFELAPDADLPQAEARLRALGMEPLTLRDLPHKRSLFVADPDGNPVEFVCRTSVAPASSHVLEPFDL